MTMTNNDIETLSVNAVRDSIVLSSCLYPFINDNDKEPSWDGTVYIYNDNSKKKSVLLGRVSVQVKGKIADNLTKDEISFPVNIDDLRNYLNDGGLIYFVVYINKTGTEKKIYYAELSPIVLRRELSAAKKQKTKNLSFQTFPKDGMAKTTLFSNFYINAQKQHSFADRKLYSIEELEKQGVLDSITVTFGGYGLPGNDPIGALLNMSPIYFYANIKGGAIPQPLEEIPELITVAEQAPMKVSIGDRHYYDFTTRMRYKDRTVVKIGDSLSIEVEQSGQSKINYKPSSKLKAHTKDLGFFIAMYENAGFTISGFDFPINVSEINATGFDIHAKKSSLEYLEKVVQVLNLLGANGDIEFKDLTKNDWANMNRLIKAFVDKNPVIGMNREIPPVACMDFGKYKFALVFAQQDVPPDTYEIHDFFKTDMKFFVTDDNDNQHEIPSYCILKADDLLRISNIRFDTFLSAFIEINTPVAIIHANIMLIELLLAYDKSRNNKSAIIRTAKSFAAWLMKDGSEILQPDITKINLLQVYKREREFTSDEVRDLYTIVEDPSQQEDILVAAHLLLGNQIAAELHFEKMEPKQQEDFRRFPIFHFWRETA